MVECGRISVDICRNPKKNSQRRKKRMTVGNGKGHLSLLVIVDGGSSNHNTTEDRNPTPRPTTRNSNNKGQRGKPGGLVFCNISPCKHRDIKTEHHAKKAPTGSGIGTAEYPGKLADPFLRSPEKQNRKGKNTSTLRSRRERS